MGKTTCIKHSMKPTCLKKETQSMKKILFLILLAIGCRGEQPYCWVCRINERYVDEHNKIINWYKYDIIIPSMTQRDIYILEDANSVIIDENRMIGTIMECKVRNTP
jgi:hypothetical protein